MSEVNQSCGTTTIILDKQVR